MALPFAAPDIQATETDPADVSVAVTAVGAAGAAGIVTTTAFDHGPCPTLLSARSLIVYVDPPVNPVLRTGDLVVAGKSAVHVAPSSREYQ